MNAAAVAFDAEVSVRRLIRDYLADPTHVHFPGAQSYVDLATVVSNAELRTLSSSVSAQAAFLAAAAGIATLLASVEIAFFPIIGFPGCTISAADVDNCKNATHDRRLLDIISLLSYLALACGAIGALLAFYIAQKLLHLAADANYVIARKARIEQWILRQTTTPPDIQKHENELTRLLVRAQRLAKLLASQKHAHWTVVVFIIAGMVLFLAALVFQVVFSQPRGIWIGFVVGIAVISLASVWDVAWSFLEHLWRWIKDGVRSCLNITQEIVEEHKGGV
ncbi:hypothetical protein C8F01DRAFT_1370455 [Mycena amicta]|nr:hypothetical protein C8F01DRAFT_1370455 [Mycena amicta]